MNQNKPNYISTSPKGEDLFEGKSHDKISKTIYNLIKEKALPNNVIGLEGQWGSGKSNVVNIIESKFKNNKSDYIFFTYDAWAHQEDLTRRTFLEELIHKLKEENKFNNKYDWEQELIKLLARKTRKTTEKFPMIKFYWIFIMASILLFTFLNTLHNDFNNYSLLKLKYLLPLILFVYGIIEFVKSYFEYNNNEETKNWDFKRRIKNLLYVFSGSDLTSKEYEFATEDDPTVKRFKEYFVKITNDLKSDGLIIVFDNMDRLSSSEKVLSLWSSIHTFFAEEKVDNVWVIIPYDKKHLAKHFDKIDNEKIDNFIGKTFSTIFRVSPPVLSDWKKFFNLKFKEAFNDIININDIDFISSLYELITDINTKRPRDIITFINNLVSLHLQHNNSIDIKYSALFILRKEEILDNPLISISSKQFLNEERHMFQAISELEENLAAIVYNVDKEKSSEILLKNSIDEIFIKANIETLREVKKHSEFKAYFDIAVNKSNFLNSRPENTAKILEEVEDVMSDYALKSYWERFANNIENRPKDEFLELLDWHKGIIKNTTKATARKITDKITNESLREFKETSNSEKYYRTAYNLFLYLLNEKKRFKPSFEKVKFNPEDFVYYIDDLSSNFKEGICSIDDLKIYTDSEELNNYFINHINGFVSEAYKFKHVIEYLINNSKFYDFEEIQNTINLELNSVAYNDNDKISNLIELNKVFNLKKTLQLIPENTGTNFLNSNGTKLDSPYFDIISNQISHMINSNPRSNVLLNELNRLDNFNIISEIIQYYVSYGDLLKIVIDREFKYVLLDELIKKLTTENFGFTQTLNINWVFKNLDKIKTKLFNDNFKVFLTQFDKWYDSFKEEEHIINVFDLEKNILKETFDSENYNFLSIKFIHNKILKAFKESSTENWTQNFTKNSNFKYAFIGLLENDLLDNKITKSKIFMEFYDKYFSSIAKNDLAIPQNESFWNKLLTDDYLDIRKLSRIYDDILDLLIDYPEPSLEQIKFFTLGIFNFSTNTIIKADSVCRKILLHLNDDSEILSMILEDHGEKIADIINASGGKYNQDLSEMFGLLLNNNSINEKSIKNIINRTKLNIPKFRDLEEEEK